MGQAYYKMKHGGKWDKAFERLCVVWRVKKTNSASQKTVAGHTRPRHFDLKLQDDYI